MAFTRDFRKSQDHFLSQRAPTSDIISWLHVIHALNLNTKLEQNLHITSEINSKVIPHNSILSPSPRLDTCYVHSQKAHNLRAVGPLSNLEKLTTNVKTRLLV